MVFRDIAGETPEDRLIRFCHVACLWAEVRFCGVNDGVCYFEWWYDADSDESNSDDGDTDESDDPDTKRPTLLSVSIGGLNMDQLIRRIGQEIENNEPRGENGV